MFLLSISFVGQAVAATITAYPTNVPKGAYVNGPGGATDDNFYWQVITLTSGAAHVATTTATITLPDGMTIADTDGDGNYSEEISVIFTAADPLVTLTPTSAAGADIVLTIGAADLALNDVIRVMIPVVTQSAPADSTQDYYVAFSGAGATDSIANGSGYFVIYKDPGATALSLVNFAANMTANDDSTTKKGERYPNVAAATFGALPDLVVDVGLIGTAVESVNRGVTMGFPALTGGVDGANETNYTVWVSTDSTLAHVDSLTAGVFHAQDYSTMLPVIQTETGTGNLRYNMAGYPEGTYFFYITSYLTGDFPLARSGSLIVRHWPVINAVGFDRNHNSVYLPGAANDDQDLTLDSGGYYNYAGVAAGVNTYTYADLYANIDDLDSNAKIYLFYSSNSSLADSNLTFTGSAADSSLAVAGLTGATPIAMNLMENAKDTQGFVRQRWNVNPDSVGVIPASDLTVYCVTTDGKHFEMSVMKGTNAANLPEITQGSTPLVTHIKHSPKLVIDGLNEYDSVVGGAINVDVKSYDQIMISWGKSGINGAVDVDDDAIMDFYIIPDNLGDGLSDYDHNGATAVRTAANGHKINTATLQEKYDSKGQMYYTWNLKNDFQTTGWFPADGTAYIIYGVISENRSSGNTEIVYSTGASFLLTAATACQTVVFANTPFARLTVPPAEGIIINAEETYRMPLTAFDWDANGPIGIFIVKNDAAGFVNGPVTTPVGNFAGVVAYDITDDDGDAAAGGAYLAENTATYYDMTLRPPVAGGTAKYTTTASGGATPLADGTYWVYIGIDPDITDGGGVPFGAGTEVLYRAPGPLTVVNAGIATVQRNLTISPMQANASKGDTLTFNIKAADNGGTVDRMDVFISVDKTWWTLANATTPFTASGGYSGKLIANSVIDDSTNNRWIFRAVVFDGGSTFAISNTGVGDDVASFQLVSKGTNDALQHLTSVGFVNDPGNNWVTKYSNDGVDLSINFLSSNVKVVPRAIVEGIVELQGRNLMNKKFTFELRKRGGYVPVTDSLFYATNDVDSTTAGFQFVPDTDGKFTFWQVPNGEYDLVAKYDRYLSKLVPVSIYPGVDTLFVSFGQLKGGDAYGYSDSLKAVFPDNQIDTGDINRVSTAFLATPADSAWNNGTDNWKWADINEDNVVEADDLSLTTSNVGTTGAQPVYKRAETPGSVNTGAVVEFMDTPTTLQAGQTYTIQVIARNTSAVRAYFVNMKYDTAALSFAGIVKGDLINSDSYSFPVINGNTVGLANSAYGDYVASGDGVLAQISFTALADGAFDPNMLSFDKISLVNAGFIKENLETGSVTDVTENAPVAFALGQNYPNPFNPSTAIQFTIPEAGKVNLEVYDLLGRHVRTVVSGIIASGQHTALWDAKDDNGRFVSAGMYIYTIRSGNFHASKKMLFMK